jgi:hypothetical protein
MPPLWLFVARALAAAMSWRGIGRLQDPVLAGAAVLVMLAPQLRQVPTAGGSRLRVESRYLVQARESLEVELENEELMRAQVVFLRRNIRPADVIVSSLDDASLGYYLGRFVYGFLNSQRDDAFFMHLLVDASRRGARVWFVDTLRAHNYCHTPSQEPRHVDCRLKYPRFYAACSPESDSFDRTCVRLTFDPDAQRRRPPIRTTGAS